MHTNTDKKEETGRLIYKQIEIKKKKKREEGFGQADIHTEKEQGGQRY